MADTQLDWLVRIDGLHLSRDENGLPSSHAGAGAAGSNLRSPKSIGGISSRASLPSGKASRAKRVVKYRRGSTTGAVVCFCHVTFPKIIFLWFTLPASMIVNPRPPAAASNIFFVSLNKKESVPIYH